MLDVNLQNQNKSKKYMAQLNFVDAFFFAEMDFHNKKSFHNRHKCMLHAAVYHDKNLQVHLWRSVIFRKVAGC